MKYDLYILKRQESNLPSYVMKNYQRQFIKLGANISTVVEKY